MLGPKADNAIGNGNDNTQIGHNSGTVVQGVPIETFVAEMQRKDAEITRVIAEKDALKDSLHGDALARQKLEFELADLRQQLDGLKERLANPKQAFAEHKQRATQIEQLLQDTATLNAISENRIHSALSAFGDLRYEEIDELLAETEKRGLIIAANAAFGRGLIAEDAVKWHDAAKLYARAAQLNPNFENLRKASELTREISNYLEAAGYSATLLTLSRKMADPLRVSLALDEHGSNVRSQGDFVLAEALYLESLTITGKIYGSDHAEYAASLNNLAGAVGEQGLYSKAEKLYRQALNIVEKIFGQMHANFALGLNNLAGVIQQQGRLSEAEELYTQAIDIAFVTIGEQHPLVAGYLNNLALVVKLQLRYSEAEMLYVRALRLAVGTYSKSNSLVASILVNLGLVAMEQGRFADAREYITEGLEIDRNTIGELHPTFATHLNSLAGVFRWEDNFSEARAIYRRALDISRVTLGDAHPNTQLFAHNLLGLIETHFPDDPDLPALRAAFPNP